jgi:asparagine synthase (glutamine-hydrolysing)
MRFARSLPADLKVDGDRVKAPVSDAASRWIPRSVVDRPKQPFTLPVAAMMRPGEALYDLVRDVLLAPDARCAEIFDQAVLKEYLHVQAGAPAARTAELLWSVLVLEQWLSVRNLTI